MKNSWTLSVALDQKYAHNYFCTCGHQFKINTSLEEEAPDLLCPLCGNDYFKDADEFFNIKGTRIWKYFAWDTIVDDNTENWKVTLKYDVPKLAENSITIEDDVLLEATFKKDGSEGLSFIKKCDSFYKYSLFKDDKAQPFKDILVQDAQKSLVKYIISSRENYKELYEKRIAWQNKPLPREQVKSIQEIQLLDSVLEKRKERIVKKTLFNAYQVSIDETNQYAKSDFVFSRTIENLDLLVELIQLSPMVKLNLFDEVKTQFAIDFINYLKNHYTEKQIARFFLKFNEETYFKDYIQDWRDIRRLTNRENGFNTLDRYFIKVKLTVNDLHNEMIRVFNMERFELEAQENFVYLDKFIDACGFYEDLEFRLPHTMQELHLWGQQLHNCMFGYSNAIKRGGSIIYGVFRNDRLLYAVEVRASRIVQALGNYNKKIIEDDKKLIDSWFKGSGL